MIVGCVWLLAEGRSRTRVLVSQQGITLSAWYPPGELVPWSQVKSVHMTYINSKYGDYVHEIVVGRKSGETEEIRVSGLSQGAKGPDKASPETDLRPTEKGRPRGAVGPARVPY
jgi:hypothetical protein